MKQSLSKLLLMLAVIAFILNASAQHHETKKDESSNTFIKNKSIQGEYDKSIKEILFYEDFSDDGFSDWTIMGDGADNWEVSATNMAGGAPPEVFLWYYPTFIGTARFVSPIINTDGYSLLNVSFLHLINSYYAGGYWIAIETTSDGGNTWNPVWELYWDSSEDYGAFEVLGVDTPDVGSENFQFCFKFDGDSDLIDKWIFDNITLSNPINYDVTPSSFVGLDDYLFEGDDTFVSAVVNNYGAETVSFDVVLEINDGTNVVFESTKTVTDLVFGVPTTVDFDVWTVGAEGADYFATVTTQLDGDENPENDQLIKPFVVFPQDHYCIPSGYCGHGDGISDFAWSGIENYGNGCSPTGYSVFTSMEASVEIGYSYTATISTEHDDQTASMWIDFNMDLEFSDNERVITDFILDESDVFYNMDIVIPGNAIPGTTVMRIGVKRGENSSQNPCATFNYGEWEDYSVEITGTSINYNAGVISIDMDPLMPVGDIIPRATVKNFGIETISFPVTLTVAGTSYSSTVNVSDLAIGEEIQLVFDTWNATTGTYTIEVCTELPNDQIPDNNCMTADVSTIGFDAGVASIDIGSVILVGDIIPSATIKNFGFETISFPVTMIIEDADYSSTVEISNLLTGQEIVVEFDTWSTESGQHFVEVCTELASDENLENDCSDMLVTISDDERQKLVIELFTGVW